MSDEPQNLAHSAKALAGSPGNVELMRALCSQIRAANLERLARFVIRLKRLGWQPADIEDVLHEALRTAFEVAIHKCERKEPLGLDAVAYSRGIVKRCLGNALRKAIRRRIRQRSELAGVDELLHDGALPETVAETSEAVDKLRSAIDALNTREKCIVEMRLAGRSFEEISRQLGMTSGTARVSYSRTIKFLRELMQADESS